MQKVNLAPEEGTLSLPALTRGRRALLTVLPSPDVLSAVPPCP